MSVWRRNFATETRKAAEVPQRSCAIRVAPGRIACNRRSNRYRGRSLSSIHAHLDRYQTLLSEFPLESPQEQMQFPEGLDYGKFQHSSRNHSRLPCLLCHRRESNAPIPKRPGGSGHLPCAGCHAQQFSSSESPICTICHTDVKSGALKSFPRLKSFRMKFDHSLHVKMGSVSCATCHRPSRGGVAFSIPAGIQRAHNLLWMSHSARAIRRPRYLFVRYLPSVGRVFPDPCSLPRPFASASVMQNIKK